MMLNSTKTVTFGIAAAAFLGAFALTTPAMAQDAPAAPAAKSHAAKPAKGPEETVETRIADLKTKLKITDAQSAQWEAVANVMRDNAKEAQTRFDARQAPVTCIHPGWPLISGRDEVLRSWRANQRNPSAPAVLCYEEHATLYGEVAHVTCEEELESGTLAAGNLFVREGGLWRLVHHQATPIHERREAPRPPRRMT